MTSEAALHAKSRAHLPVNVLLVDDTPAKLLAYEVILAELGENLIKAASAAEAFAILIKTDVAVILTDVSMPTLDGFEFAKLVRSHPRFEFTPIVFVSAIAHSDLDRLHGYTSGAVDYITAPVVPEVLRAKVRIFAELYRKQRELEAAKRELETRVAERTARLAESEQRYRTLVDNANDIVATMDLEARITSVNPVVERILGYTPEELIGTHLGAHLPKDEIEKQAAMLRRKLEGEPSTQYETHVLAKDGQRRVTLEVNSKLIFDGDGNAIGIHSIARDISERKEAEARQAVLIRELQHRTKNLLAVIQSIAINTLSHSRDLTSASDAILGRLHALARAQEFITTGTTAGVSLRALIEAELSGFASRYQLNGVPVIANGAFAQQFALVIHELATNAAKHGALSSPAGRVVVNWHIDTTGDDALLHFAWVERGGPPVSAPNEFGFGSRLLAVASTNEPRISFAPDGLEFHVDVPFSDVIGAARQG